MGNAEQRLEPQWHFSSCLGTVGACALGIGIAFCSLSQKSTHPRLDFFLVALPTLSAFVSSAKFSPDDFVNEIFARFLLIFLAHQSFLHCILSPEELDEQRRDFEKTHPKDTLEDEKQKSANVAANRASAATHNWIFAYKMLFNGRCLGTPWQVGRSDATKRTAASTCTDKSTKEGSPRQQPSQTTDYSSVRSEPRYSSRNTFIVKRLGILALRYLVLCIYYDPGIYLYMPDGIPWQQGDFSPVNQATFWRNLYSFPAISEKSRRFLVRSGLIKFHLVADQIIPDYLTLSSYHDILSVAAVSLGVDAPEEWPSFFGHLGQAFTVRRYWSQFWHHLVYRSFSAHGECFLKKAFGIRKRSAMTRYLNNAFVFVLSGLMHALVEWTMTPDACSRCGCWATHWRYCLQIVAIVGEELFIASFHAVERKLVPRRERSVLLSTLYRIVGYTWVIGWTIWSKEVTFFPRAYCLLAEDGM